MRGMWEYYRGQKRYWQDVGYADHMMRRAHQAGKGGYWEGFREEFQGKRQV